MRGRQQQSMRSISNNDDINKNNNSNNSYDSDKINLHILVSQILKFPVKESLKSLDPMSPSTVRYFSALNDFIATLRGFVNGRWSQDQELMRPRFLGITKSKATAVCELKQSIK